MLSRLFIIELFAVSLLVPPGSAVAHEAPVVLWCSSPVQPGETVLAHGGQFGDGPVVELPCGGQKRVVEPISVSETAILFVLPQEWQPGIVHGVIRSSGPESLQTAGYDQFGSC